MSDKKLELSRRKILGSVGAVGAAGAAAGLGTSALFSDEESFENNSVTAGTLDMTVDARVPDGAINDEYVGAVGFSEYNPPTADGPPGVGVTLDDFKPGDWVLLCYEIEVQENPACLGLKTENTANDENTVTEPEADSETAFGNTANTDPTDTDIDGDGELAQSLSVTVYDDFDDSVTIDGDLSNAESALSNELLGGVTLQDVWDTFDTGDAIADETNAFDFYVLLELPIDVGNEVQSDSVEWDFVFDAVQSRNTDDDPYGNACTPVWEEDGGECDCPDTSVDTTASQSPEVSVTSTDATSFPQVTTFLDIDTTAGNNGNLVEDDFALAESGPEGDCGQDVNIEITGEGKAVDFAFLLDVTGSMGPFIDGLKSDIQGFIDDIETEGIDARYALYLYGDDDGSDPAVFLKQDFTTESDTFKNSVDDVSLGEVVGFGGDGPEDNYEAILTADNDLSYRSEAQRVTVDITDAPGEEDSGSFIGGLEETRANAVSVLNDGDYTYVAVAEDQTGPNEKKSLAEDDVDDGLFVELGTNFDPILDEVRGEVENSYRVRYTTSCQVEDGSTRDVVVEIEDPDEGTLYGTTSYTAP